MIISIFDHTGDFAEDKDRARYIRKQIIVPALLEKKEVILDFTNVSSATQSFIHALIREIIKEFGVDILDQIKFKNCNEKLKKLISIVVEYVQDT
jgi:hypothetical protein